MYRIVKYVRVHKGVKYVGCTKELSKLECTKELSRLGTWRHNHSNIGGAGVVERCTKELGGRLYLDLFQLVRWMMA